VGNRLRGAEGRPARVPFRIWRHRSQPGGRDASRDIRIRFARRGHRGPGRLRAV